jgi:hypothetical protein
MLDLQLKHLRVMENYVNYGNTINFHFEYNVKVIIPFLMTCFHWFNFTIQKCRVDGPSDELNEIDINIFGLGTSMEKSSHARVIRKLYLFKRSSVFPPNKGISHHMCWVVHQWRTIFKCCIHSPTNYLHSLVTNEIEIMFNLARVLRSLWPCHLQVDNLDQIITMVKYWFNGPCFNCKKNVDMKKYWKWKHLWWVATMTWLNKWNSLGNYI